MNDARPRTNRPEEVKATPAARPGLPLSAPLGQRQRGDRSGGSGSPAADLPSHRGRRRAGRAAPLPQASRRALGGRYPAQRPPRRGGRAAPWGKAAAGRQMPTAWRWSWGGRGGRSEWPAGGRVRAGHRSDRLLRGSRGEGLAVRRWGGRWGLLPPPCGKMAAVAMGGCCG